MVNDALFVKYPFPVVSVAFPGNVEEGGVDDQLVELAVGDEDSNQLVQVALVGLGGADVGRFAAHVLAINGAVHQAVEFGTAISAVYVDGLAVTFPQGVENLIN